MANPWLNLLSAVYVLGNTLDLSAAPACAALCDACATRQLRWRYVDAWSRGPDLQTWRDGYIDEGGDLVVGHARFMGLALWICGDDLVRWVHQHPRYEARSNRQTNGGGPEVSPAGPATKPPAVIVRDADIEKAREIARVYIEDCKNKKCVPRMTSSKCDNNFTAQANAAGIKNGAIIKKVWGELQAKGDAPLGAGRRPDRVR
ncbi:MAG TPA: hypothetical protein VHY35_07310 [Stellaceae bacterium]|jgi:hypothetical protein|nr:hypothetical protein [Stellaceae bacterium]